ncbi:MAG: hypothetical protein AB1782_11795 [Cyanobacteriota bacterium]
MLDIVQKGAKPLREVTITEYAHLNKISVSAVYKRISRGKLKTTQGVRNNQNCTLILIEDHINNFGQVQQGQKPQYMNIEENVQSIGHHVQDAEIITESTQHNLVSMENTTFEQLIQHITNLAEARATTEKESFNRLEQQFMEIKAENTQLKEQVDKYKFEAIQNEAELKIAELKIKELEEKINYFNSENNSIWTRINKPRKL